MAARKPTRVNRKYKTKYGVTNWPEYERGLKSRGDITVWFSQEAREAWTPPRNGRRGGHESGNRDGVDVAHGLPPAPAVDRGLPGFVVAVDGARP